MKRFKKLLLGLVAFAAMAVICAVCAGAEEYTSGLWKYIPQNDGTIYISSYAGFGDDLTIPSTIDGLNVSGIADEAFRGNQNIGKVTLPSNIKFIGYMAFADSSLTSINIPSSVTDFEGYNNFGGIDFSYAFSNCDSLTTVVFNANTSVPTCAFEGCDSLTTVTIGNSTTGIDDYAFKNCYALKTIKLGNKVEYIGREAFYNTSSLQSITCGSGLTEICDDAFRYSGIKSFAIPTTVTHIGCWAFADSSLTSINIPSSVTDFGDIYSSSYAFSNCDSLTTVVFNANTSVPTCAFEGCDSLTTVTIGNSTTGIDDYAFENCYALKTIKLGNKVKYIGEKAFYNTSSLQSITCGSGLTEIYDYAFLYSGIKSFAIPPTVTYIGYGAFDGSAIESVIIPSSVTNLVVDWYSCRTFADCEKLKSVTIGDAYMPLDVDDIFEDSNNVKIYCIKDSLAHQYAVKYGIPYSATINPIKLTSIKLNKEEYTLAVGDTLKLYPTITPQNTTDRIEWISGDTNIATVDGAGVITGISEGTVAIRVKCSNGKSANCVINVAKDAVTSTDEVLKKNIALAYTNKLSNATYTGSAQKPAIGVMFNAFTKLIPNVDYKIAYSNNVNVGTATIKITGIGNYTGTITKTFEILPKNVTGFKLGGRASNALRLNWTKNTSADGYIIEQYKSGKWVRIAKITSNATTTYRVSGLSAGTAYKFRMKAYKKSGSTALYSGYTATFAARTNPSNVTGVKIGGKASNALRVNWTKNTSADGYIVEIYKGGKWVRAAKITKNTTVAYRISGLAKNTTYKIRIKAYKMSGSTALYSGYTTISGKTTA